MKKTKRLLRLAKEARDRAGMKETHAALCDETPAESYYSGGQYQRIGRTNIEFLGAHLGARERELLKRMLTANPYKLAEVSCRLMSDVTGQRLDLQAFTPEEWRGMVLGYFFAKWFGGK